MKKLRESFSNSVHYKHIENTYDIKEKWEDIRINPDIFQDIMIHSLDQEKGVSDNMAQDNITTERGLSGVLKSIFGKSLNKDMQRSNWENRPLSVDQIRYAASDAYCLILIWDSLHSRLVVK